MPQMAPLMWLNLYFFFIMCFLFFNILNFFNFKYNNNFSQKTTTTFKKSILNNFLWKW